jgi:hypothetical protein
MTAACLGSFLPRSATFRCHLVKLMLQIRVKNWTQARDNGATRLAHWPKNLLKAGLPIDKTGGCGR